MAGTIQNIKLDKIVNYYENPRHEVGSDEKDTLKKLFNAVGVQYMLNLAEDIMNNGLLGSQHITVVYSEKIKKYIVYEGNRRVACAKLLSNPEYFNFLDKATINKISKISEKNKVRDLYELSCYVTNEKEALFIMERVHSGEDKGRGVKAWTPREKEIFKVRQKDTKSLAYLVDFYVKNYFGSYDITQILPFTTIQRIFNNREVKKKIGIDVLDETTFTKQRMQTIIDASKWLVKKAEEKGEAPTRLYNKSRSIEDEIIPWLDEYFSEMIPLDIDGKNEKVIDTIPKNSKEENTDNVPQQKQEDKNVDSQQQLIKESHAQIVNTPIDDASQKSQLLMPNQVIGTGGKANLPYFFQGLDYGHLKPSDQDTHGVTSICRELQLFSVRKIVSEYPIASAFLVRSIIEQSIKYYSKKHKIQGQNKLIWENIKDISKLSTIITVYKKNLPNYIIDSNMRGYFTDLFDNYESNVNPLNWVVHRPDEYRLDTKTLIELPGKGLLSLINFFLR